MDALQGKEYLPPAHSWHALLPVVLEYVPAPQSTHVAALEAPSAAECLPAAQLMPVKAPAYVPAGQLVQIESPKNRTKADMLSF